MSFNYITQSPHSSSKLTLSDDNISVQPIYQPLQTTWEDDVSTDNVSELCEQTLGSVTYDLSRNVSTVKIIPARRPTYGFTVRDSNLNGHSFDPSRLNFWKGDSEPRESLFEMEFDGDSDTRTFSDMQDSYTSIKTLDSPWGRFALEISPWKDEDEPFVNIISYESLTLTDEEKNGLLTDRIVAACSSYLDQIPELYLFHPTKVNLSHKSLNDVRILGFHHYLQHIDLSYNQLTDISCLGECPFLMYLDVSRNRLTKLLNFKAPWNLTFVNYSCNKVTEIPDLSDFWSICYLDLSCNKISRISGLEKLRYLRTLILADNNIIILEDLNNLRIEDLDLRNNEIRTVEDGPFVGLKTLQELLWLNLADNQISDLRFLQKTVKIKQIDLRNNKIADLIQLCNLGKMQHLSQVDLRGNDVTNVNGYREICTCSIKSLTLFDGTHVEVADKVSSSMIFCPDLWVCAVKNYARMTYLRYLNRPKIDACTFPFDSNVHPIVALVGPPGSKKDAFIKNFIKHYPKKAYRAILHTTRPIETNEVNGVDNYFVNKDEFNTLAREAEFLCMYEEFGFCVGFSRKELIQAMDKKAICMLTMDFTAALILRLQGFSPFMILAMPNSEAEHYETLVNRYNPVYWDYKNKDKGALLLYRDNVKPGAENLRRFANSVRSSSVVWNLPNNSEEVISLESCCDCTCDCGGKPMLLSRSMENTLLRRSESQIYHMDDLLKSFSKFDFDLSTNHLDKVSIQNGTVILASFDDTSQNQSLGGSSKPDLLSMFFTSFILNSRGVYLDLHHSNPGLFFDTLDTENIDDHEKMISIIKRIIRTCAKPREKYKFQEDDVYMNMVNYRLDQIQRDLNMTRNTAAYQRYVAKKSSDPDQPLQSETYKPNEAIVAKYNRLQRLSSSLNTKKSCPNHLSYSSYRTFTE